jgi:hypothetical protein
MNPVEIANLITEDIGIVDNDNDEIVRKELLDVASVGVRIPRGLPRRGDKMKVKKVSFQRIRAALLRSISASVGDQGETKTVSFCVMTSPGSWPSWPRKRRGQRESVWSSAKFSGFPWRLVLPRGRSGNESVCQGGGVNIFT